MNALFLGAASLLALLLAVVGVYGLVANTVVERTREFGIRMALGSTVSNAIWTAAAPGALLTLGGVVLGGGLSWVAVRVLKGFLFGITPVDPLTFVGASAVLIIVGCLASLAPALNLARLAPADVLRQD